MNFLVDAQLPPALARWIEQQGCKAKHVQDLGLAHDEDVAIWTYAAEHGFVVISKDEDFVDHWLLSAQPVPLIWIRKGNCSNPALVEWLKKLWPEITARLKAGERFIELRA